MATLDDRQKGRLALGFVGFIALCFAAAAFGGFFTAPATAPGGWYDWIRKPAWTPPPWLFGPVWTLLYGAMAVAAWLVWREGGWAVQRRPLALFMVQLVLNALWSLFFFGMQSPGLALADIALLWLAILATILAFRKISSLAAGLLGPYLLWVSFAAALNFAVWRLNG